MTRPGGTILISSYAGAFWPFRLEWFRLQADAGLIGEIDTQKSVDGVIVCKDGFNATTFAPSDFHQLVATLGLECQVEEIDGSSVFCDIRA